MAEKNLQVKDFYFLHIPKTGGSHFKSRILNEVYEQFKINDITFIRQSTVHDAWSKKISDDTYVTTILRDPAKRTVSHFCHLASVFPMNPKKNKPSLSELKYEFDKWIKNGPVASQNFQAKNILFENVLEAVDQAINKDDEPDNWWNSELFKNFEIDELELKRKLKRIDLLIDNELLKNKDSKTLVFNKIFNDFNISYVDPNRKYVLHGSMINALSKELYDSLSEKEIQNLYDINKIDSEIYFSDYFTKLG